MNKTVKVLNMPISLWKRAKSVSALLGLTLSQYAVNVIQAAVEKAEKKGKP